MSAQYRCQTPECGHKASTLLLRCPLCKQWNTFRDEEAIGGVPAHLARSTSPTSIEHLAQSNVLRLSTGIEEVDRVLGGGIVAGSIIALGGDPGCGKSTLALQIADGLAKQKLTTLYSAGEESPQQIKMRADRLDASSKWLQVVAETNIERILEHATQIEPSLLIIDSINTTWTTERGYDPGSITTARIVISRLLEFSKQKTAIPILIISHVTKEGTLAGPKQLEHMVDAVFFLSSEREADLRILTATKNRFGQTEEMGFFKMTERGLLPDVPDFLQSKEVYIGHAIAITRAGTRLLFAEIQALVCDNMQEAGGKRLAYGIDANRFGLLLAVLQKAGVSLAKKDVFVDVAGGMVLKDRLSDMAILLAILSSALEVPLGLIVGVGEMQINGTLRATGITEQMISEITRHPFEYIVVPHLTKGVFFAAEHANHPQSKFDTRCVGFRLATGLIDWMKGL